VIDTHAHLDACADPIGDVVARARDVGVDRIVAIGSGIDSSRTTLASAARHDGVYAALGVHPHQAGGLEAGRLDELRDLLAHPAVVALGEIGLDFFRDVAPRARQLAVFERQLELATDLGLPVVIHCRDAEAETADALGGFAGTVVLHCFSSPGLLPVALDRGYFVSFAGNVTYPKAAALRSAAGAVPRNRILAETDSPYLAPQPVRGRPNEPANVRYTLAALAEARGETPAALTEAIDGNATASFAFG
jgi:TatD DNase family protein